MKSISLHGSKGEGMSLLCDDEDYPLLSSYKWYVSHGYAATVVHLAGAGGKSRTVSANRQKTLHAHLLVHPSPYGFITDHKNRNRLDCTRGNLRSVTHRHSVQNRTMKLPMSGFWGVLQESTNCFSAKYDRAKLGCYRTAEYAALARDREVRRKCHEDVDLNFPDIRVYPDDLVPQPPRTLHSRSSTVVGVSYSHTRKAREKWRAVKSGNHIGWFLTEVQAIDVIQEFENANQERPRVLIRRTRAGI